MKIQNTTWVSPLALQLQLLQVLFLIIITLSIEYFIMYFYARRKDLNNINELLCVVTLSNFITGLIGIIFVLFRS